MRDRPAGQNLSRRISVRTAKCMWHAASGWWPFHGETSSVAGIRETSGPSESNCRRRPGCQWPHSVTRSACHTMTAAGGSEDGQNRACSPKTGPDVMNVATSRSGTETVVKRKRHAPKHIIRRLREMDALLATGTTPARHRTGILARYDSPISTGPLDGTNNKIRTFRRQACGLRDSGALQDSKPSTDHTSDSSDDTQPMPALIHITKNRRIPATALKQHHLRGISETVSLFPF